MEDDAEGALVIALGRAFHQSGVPSDQLESIMRRTADALGVELQVTALPTSITAAIGPASAQKVVLLRLEPGAIDLRRLALLNVLLDLVLARRVGIAEAREQIERIAGYPHAATPILTIIAYCALSLGAAIILGGRLHENAAATAIGIATGTIAVIAQRSPTVDRLFEVLAAFAATIVVAIYSHTVAPVVAYIPIVAGVVQLLPGLQLTQALHELAYRNLVAGTARLGSVMMTLLSLGCGFALAIAAIGSHGLQIAPAGMTHTPPYEVALAIVAVAMAISILENARAVDTPWVLGSCAIAEIAYRSLAALPGYQVSAFGAAVLVGVLANAAGRYARIPQPVLLIPGLLILVPGSLSYESILFILQSDPRSAGGIALNAAIAAVEIVAGLLLAQLFSAPQRRPAGAFREHE